MENVNLEIMSAEKFYQDSINSQRKLVNVAIAIAMQGSNPIVKLPVQLYEKINRELNGLGWKTEFRRESNGYVSWLSPVCIDEGSELPAYFPPLAEKFITAEKDYEATLKKQRIDLACLISKAMEAGDSELKLEYLAYPTLRKEMDKNGWQHEFGYVDAEKKERCSMFYPRCGFKVED